jgi:wobble nucleotide-excising tRNase
VTVIQRIARLRHPGVFRDFVWPADLPAFGRYNLIYGWNGSGKTTLSRVFRCLEQRRLHAAGTCTVQVDGAEIGEQDFTTATVPLRVFNRDFVEESVFPVGGGEVPPIFVVGKESIEKQKRAEELRLVQAEREAEFAQLRSTLQRAERDLEKFCTDQARVIKDTLRISGAGKYNEYDKRAFRTQADEFVAGGWDVPPQLTDAERDRLLLEHRANPRPRIPEIAYRFADLLRARQDVAELLATTVTSKAIESLRSDPELGNWVQHGVGIHKARSSESCLFCEQALPGPRMAALEAHFSTQFGELVRRLDELSGSIRSALKSVLDLRFPDRSAVYEHLSDVYDAQRQAVQSALDVSESVLRRLLHSLEKKRSRAFDPLALDVEAPQLDVMSLDRLNEVIRSHNLSSTEFQERTASARDKLAADLVVASLDEYSARASAVKAASDAISPLAGKVAELTAEIEALERDIVEHQLPADEVNDDLAKYLGHVELRLEVRKTGYVLTRDGVPAQALSEGERTALALLYFLKCLTDRRFDLKNGVVVLDDPVSSLDANALYLAFGFIRQRTQDAGQLFLFTHNFTFFRQVRNWFDHLNRGKPRDSQPARFYMVERVLGVTPRCSAIRRLDPLLCEYESEYHYLFARVSRAAADAGPVDLAESYGLPNVCRRLLEMFLAFRQPQPDDLWKKLRKVRFDEAKKVRILRFVHTYSHGDAVGEPEHDPSLLGEGSAVLGDLLELIAAEDPAHYAAMKALVDVVAEEADA